MIVNLLEQLILFKIYFFCVLFLSELGDDLDNTKIVKSLTKPSTPEFIATPAYDTVYFQDGKSHQKILVPEKAGKLIFTRFFFTFRAMTGVLASTNRFVVQIDNAHRVPLS